MKEKLFTLCLFASLLCAFIFTGCYDEKEKKEEYTAPVWHYKEYQKVEHIGQVPDKLKKVVEDNVFYDITAFGERLLKAEIPTVDIESKTVNHNIQMSDKYGNKLASYTVSSHDAYHVSTLTATSDGGFLFVLGFNDYSYDKNTWASDSGFASRVIKCDKDGNLQFDTPFNEIAGSALKFCFEKDSKFYLFGTIETPEKKTKGVYSSTDIYMAILDKDGVFIKSQCIAGSDFDSLYMAEYTDNGFILSISSQSDDGDFANSNSNGYPTDWIITVNGDLEITEKKLGSGRDIFDTKIGEKENRPVYKSDDFLKDFDAGTPNTYINYGDFYLIVSENITGEYENTPPEISSIWHYTETVYSGYDNNGNLIFRTSVDSSPDYDKMYKSF